MLDTRERGEVEILEALDFDPELTCGMPSCQNSAEWVGACLSCGKSVYWCDPCKERKLRQFSIKGSMACARCWAYSYFPEPMLFDISKI